jgi:probable HAF family extracellular repeat protein
MVDLGTLGGSFSEALAVNAGGQVVGRSMITADSGIHAFCWTQTGGMIDLSTFGLGGGFSVAVAVNDGGEAVGRSGPGNGHATPARRLVTTSGSSTARLSTACETYSIS